MTKTNQATNSPSSWSTCPVTNKPKPKKKVTKTKVTAKELYSKSLTLEWEYIDHHNTMKRGKEMVIKLGGFMENYRQTTDRYETEKEDEIHEVEKEIQELEITEHTNRGDLDELAKLDEQIRSKIDLVKEKKDTIHILHEMNTMMDMCFNWFDKEKEELTKRMEKMKKNVRVVEGERNSIESNFDI